MIAFENVSKRYGSVAALDHLDLQIGSDATVAILGPNGAGKTTAISLALGLRTPSSGTVRVLGHDPHDLRAHTAVGAMLQTSGIPGYLSVDEAIELFRTYYPRPLSRSEIIATAGLEGLGRARVTTLSGGELQRLYFALAICGNPRVLLLDEPTVGLDVEARRGMLQTIRTIAGQGRTVVLTTHYLEEADALADRVVVLNRGRIIADGPPSQIKANIARKRLEFRSSSPQTLEALQAAEASQVERPDDQTFVCLTEQPERALYELFSRGAQISDLTVTGASLEEAFLALTASEESHAA